MQFGLWKIFTFEGTLVYFMSETVPNIHTIKRTNVIGSLPFKLQLVEISVSTRSLDPKLQLTQNTLKIPLTSCATPLIN